MIFVMAINYRAAMQWKQETGIGADYLYDNRQLLGTISPQIVRLPGWEQNPIYDWEFEEMIKTRQWPNKD